MFTWALICLTALPPICEGSEILGYYPDGSATCEEREATNVVAEPPRVVVHPGSGVYQGIIHLRGPRFYFGGPTGETLECEDSDVIVIRILAGEAYATCETEE